MKLNTRCSCVLTKQQLDGNKLKISTGKYLIMNMLRSKKSIEFLKNRERIPKERVGRLRHSRKREIASGLRY
jgi:hypothetical protein